MFRKFTLSLLLTVSAFLIGEISFANLITVTGGSTPYNLSNGDTLFIASGTYTGSVSGLTANNRTIIVAGGATFQPVLLDGTNNGVVCKMHIYGTFTYSLPLTTNTNFTLDNYAGGVVNLAAMNTKGKDQVWTNHLGGTINFSGDVLVNGGTQEDDNNVFYNYETINATTNFVMKSGSKFYNYKDFNVSGNYTANGGILENSGNFVVTGAIDLNSGASQLTNHCRMQAGGGISISNGTFINYSYVWAQNSDVVVSSGGIIQNITVPGSFQPPMIHGKNFTQSGGTISGPARLYFWGTTTKTGGTIGVAGVTTDTIKMNDITRSNPPQIFDAPLGGPGGTTNPNVIYNAWGAPDSNRTYLFGCSVEIFLEIPLVIHWNSFDVILLNGIPQLIWSAEFDRSTTFDIQRSYDGSNFSSIKTVPSEVGRSDYRTNDELLNVNAPIVYYRIKATQISGEEKYTEIRMVRFTKKPGNIFTAPNPFTNNFIINYTAAEKEMVTIRMFNVNGQQQLAKNVAVNVGNNRIDVTEAANLADGVYIIQVTNGYKIISSSKIIKQ